ncbi:unnamed protein product [Lactuca saligna]|uniref:Uncharacterized protein n=1 Tax=Lactuca saligna TaxID=75948 RepID=A0AA36EP89_LACSI|nr:unnamed protein product [Lactuca saligna]
MLTITVCKHFLEKVRPIFSMLHRLEGVPESGFIPKQGGEGASTKEEPKAPVKHKAPVQPVIKLEPKGKENMFNKEPIIDDGEEEKPDEEELKRQKAHEAEMDEHQRIIREAGSRHSSKQEVVVSQVDHESNP